MQEIIEKLFLLKDEKYSSFQSKLIPNINDASVIGVRTPELRMMAKDLYKESLAGEFDMQAFFSELPHKYFEENQIHAFLIGEYKDFDCCIKEIEHFLPYIDNWATCDQLKAKVFKKHKKELFSYIEKWLASEKTYTVRFGIEMLMNWFLDDDFEPLHLELVGNACRPHIKNADDNYYINMMVSWYFATALAKQWNHTFAFIQKGRLNEWCYKKTIQKACESYRITDEQKATLKALR